MARDYATVTPRFWTGDTGRRLRGKAEAQVVAAYLLTGPSANMIGLYYLPIPTLAHETGLTLEGASKALRSLSDEGFAFYDAERDVVWVPEMGRHQVGPSLTGKDKRIAGAVREAVPYRNCRFYREFVARYSVPWNLPEMPECTATESPLGAPSKGLRCQEQEQEQDQDHASPLASERAAPAEDSPRKPLTLVDYEPSVAAQALAGLDAAIREEYPLTRALLDRLEARGWNAGMSPAKPTRKATEERIRIAGLEVAEERLMAMVEADRAMGVVPRESLGWHQDVILPPPPKVEPRREPTREADPVLDPEWLASLKPEAASKAERLWSEQSAQVIRMAYPDKRHEMLLRAREHVMHVVATPEEALFP